MEKCYYLEDKPNRDRVREDVWNLIYDLDSSITDLDSKIETLNEFLTAQLELNVQKDVDQDEKAIKHDDWLSDLKAISQQNAAWIQEIAAQQHLTDEKVAELEMLIKALKEHLDNGWRNEFITLVVSQILELFKQAGTHIFSVEEQKMDIKAEKWKGFFRLLSKALTVGGVGYLLLERLIT